MAVIASAMFLFSLAQPAVAVADASLPTQTPDSTTTTSTSTAGTGTGVTTSTTNPVGITASTSSTTLAPVPNTLGDTTTVAPPTTMAPPTTSTTLSGVQLASLIEGLNRDLAQAQAVSDYLAARMVASSLIAGQSLGPVTDPVLVAAAATQLRISATQFAAQQRFDQARHRIGQVAVALYLGDQIPRAGEAIVGSPGDRAAFLARILDGQQNQAKLAKEEFARASAAALLAKKQADQLVQARTVELQAIAIRIAAAAQQAAAVGGVGGIGGVAAGAPSAGWSAGLPPSGLIQESPTILGPSVLSADELVGWFHASGRQPHLTVTLPTLAAAYESVGAMAGVRADIALAQSVLETGYFSFPSFGQVTVADNNFAGIGACDSCATGFRFPDAVTGVRAQMQLLHAYATTSQPVPGPLPGPFRVAGCCPTWMQLTGVWATAPDYGVKILNLYRSMVQWALARRTAAAHL